MTSKTCLSCTQEMAPVVDWVQRCPNCGLEMSSLESGAATVVGGGLEPLRRKNFETIWFFLEQLGEVRDRKSVV